MRRLAGAVGAAAGALAVAVAVPAAAAGKTITLGSTAGTPEASVCPRPVVCTYVPSVGGLAPSLIVPFVGTVTSFSVNSGSPGGSVVLRVLRGSGGIFIGVSGSTPQTLGLGITTFPVSMAVRPGDVLALDNDSSALLFDESSARPFDVIAYFQPRLREGEIGRPTNILTTARLLLSATVESKAPAIAAFRQSHRAWRGVGGRGARRYPRGTAFSFRLDQPAHTRLVFVRRRTHRPAGTVELEGHEGENRVRFDGLLSNGARLGRGRYTVQLTATNASGDVTVSRRLTFRVV